MPPPSTTCAAVICQIVGRNESDGKTLYFTSGRDGYSCLWGQRLDAGSHRPVGEAFSVQHLHGRWFFDHFGWSAAAGRIAIPLVEMTGNLWVMSRAAR